MLSRQMEIRFRFLKNAFCSCFCFLIVVDHSQITFLTLHLFLLSSIWLTYIAVVDYSVLLLVHFTTNVMFKILLNRRKKSKLGSIGNLQPLKVTIYKVVV